MAEQNSFLAPPLDAFSNLAYLADASITCAEMQTKATSENKTLIGENKSEGINESQQSDDGQVEVKDEDVQGDSNINTEKEIEEVQILDVQEDIPDKVDNRQSATEQEISSTMRWSPGESAVEAVKSRVETAVGGCKECLTLSLKDLAQHIISKHKGVDGFTCDFCHTLYASSVSFGKHILSHVINVGAEHGNDGNEESVDSHINPEKDGDGTYHCSTCDKRFSSYLDLQRHLSLHKSYVCAVCDKGFSRPVVFKKHMQLHSREEVRLCEEERDQLYEEIKAAAAVSKVTSQAATAELTEEATDSNALQSPDDDSADSKKRKRKNTPLKLESDTQQVPSDIALENKKAGKKGGEKKGSDLPAVTKKKRVKPSKEDEGFHLKLEGDESDDAKEDEAAKTELDSIAELPNNEAQVELKEGVEQGIEVPSGVVEQPSGNTNVLMDAVEATVAEEAGTVILIASNLADNETNDVVISKDEPVKDEQDIKLKMAKEREKARRPTSKRSSSYKCSQCSSEFRSRQEARDHERQKHNAVLPWQCEVCGEGFWSSSQFKKHSYVEHNDNVPFKCEHCGKKLSGPGILRTHLGIHTGIRPYACHICNRDFLTRTNLQDHLIKHANPRGYCCQLCPSKFNLRTDLSSHVRTVHENIRPWKCEHCEYAFPRQSALLRHMRTHTGEKPHKCEFCGKTFARVENCMEHRRIHTGERPHVCEVCGKTFKDSGNFSNHRKIHKDGYVPRRKKKANAKQMEEKVGSNSPGKGRGTKVTKTEDGTKTYGVIGPDGKVVGTAFESLGSAVAALGSDGRVAFETLGSAVAALMGSSLPSGSSQASTSAETGSATVSSAEVDAAINGTLVGNGDSQGQTVTVGADNIALASYPAGVVQGAAVPTATLHDIVNAATMSATMVSNVPAQNETEVQEAMTHSNTFLQIGNILFSLDVDNGLKTLNQVGNMGEFLTLSLAGAQVDADGQTVISQAAHGEPLQGQEGVQHVQIGVLPESTKTAEPGQIQIQAIVGNNGEEAQPGSQVPQEQIARSDQALLACVVDDPSIVQHLGGSAAEQTSESGKALVEGEGHREQSEGPRATGSGQEIDEMQILPRAES